jgi:hypothetical protein
MGLSIEGRQCLLFKEILNEFGQLLSDPVFVHMKKIILYFCELCLQFRAQYSGCGTETLQHLLMIGAIWY